MIQRTRSGWGSISHKRQSPRHDGSDYTDFPEAKISTPSYTSMEMLLGSVPQQAEGSHEDAENDPHLGKPRCRIARSCRNNGKTEEQKAYQCCKECRMIDSQNSCLHDFSSALNPHK